MFDMNHDDQPLVGLVTVTFNSSGVIEDFLRSVLAQRHVNFLLYIVDNSSKDDTLSKIVRYTDPRLRVIARSENTGFAGGSNIGMRSALADGCDSVLLINNDTVFEDEMIFRLLQSAKKLNADMIVPKILYFDRPRYLWAAGGGFNRFRGYATFHFGENEIDSEQYNLTRTVEFAPACCMLVSREAINLLGYFDERYFVYTEDADYCWRARSIGLKLWYSPCVSILHKASSLTGGAGSPFVVRYTTRNRVLFIRKHLSLPSAIFFLCALQVLIHWKLISRQDRWSIYRLKQRSFREGLIA
jgi:GT2 family glycosyltransferase